MRNKLIVLSTMFLSTTTFAQSASTEIAMADGLYQSGKIYVVVGVIFITFAAFTAYLWRIDTKLKKIEKENNN